MACGCAEKAEVSAPNIILMLADDLGYNDLSCYREAHPRHSDRPPTSQTPVIDRLAGEGMLFTDFYAGAPVCSPSRSVLITGRNATRNGIYNWIPGQQPMHLRSGEVTLAEMLKEKGYHTAHFGKWHLTASGTSQPLPGDQGYDYSFYSYNNAHPSHKDPDNYFRNGEPVGKTEGYACRLVVEEAIGWLENIRDENGRVSRPFYINIWFNEPHVPLAAPGELTSRHDYHRDYYGAIENMDLAAGKLLNYVSTLGIEEETVIIFTSDNGSKWPHSNDPLRGEKCFNYEGGVRVPFIIKWSGRVPAGSVSHVPGSFTDVMLSVAEFAGTSIPEGRTLDGISLAPVFTGQATFTERNDPIFFYRYFHDPICMLREGKWGLLGYEDEPLPRAENLNEGELDKIKPWGFTRGHMEYIREQEPVFFELYDLEADMEQKYDLADDHPGRVERMKEKMLDLLNEMVEEGGDWYAD